MASTTKQLEGGVMVGPGGRDIGYAKLLHGLRNSATSVSLAIHSLSKSREITNQTDLVRLQIAQKEIDTIRRLLDELESLERNR